MMDKKQQAPDAGVVIVRNEIYRILCSLDVLAVSEFNDLVAKGENG